MFVCNALFTFAGEMLRTYNCGLGMCMIVSSQCTDHVLSQCNDALASSNLSAFKVGKVLPRKSLIERVVVENVEEAFNAVSEKVCTGWPISHFTFYKLNNFFSINIFIFFFSEFKNIILVNFWYGKVYNRTTSEDN